MKPEHVRPEVLEGAPLRYAPLNELGVIFLFAHLAKRWGLRIDAIQPGYPDCIAYQKIKGGERPVKIEFEHKSKNFRKQGHDPKRCDWIVCWEHNGPDVPPNLRVVELRREFGLGFNVWIVPLSEPYKQKLENIKSISDAWSLPGQCHKGDLILYYFILPEQCIKHIFVATDRAQKVTAGWKKGKDYMGPIRRVCHLKSPIFMEDLINHRILSTSHFARNQMQGRPSVTEYWPYLYEMIVSRNRSVQSKLSKFAPAKM